MAIDVMLSVGVVVLVSCAETPSWSAHSMALRVRIANILVKILLISVLVLLAKACAGKPRDFTMLYTGLESDILRRHCTDILRICGNMPQD